MTSYDSLQSPSKLFAHSRHIGNIPTTAPKRSLQRQFSFKSPERHRLNFDHISHNSTEGMEIKLLDKGRKVVELESKIELVLRNNKELVDENQEMKSMLMIQRNEIDSLRARRSRALDVALTEELENKNYEHRVEVEKLLCEITRLQEEFILVENAKNLEVMAVRDQFERANLFNVDNLRRSQDGISEAYQLQIRKLGDVIQFKEEDIGKLIITHRREKDILLEQIAVLKSELKHILALKNTEISELKFGYEAELERLERQARQKEETQNQAHDSVLKRMNRQMVQRLNDIERLTDQLKNNNAQNNELYKQLDNEKKRFQNQLDAQMENAKERIKDQKEKMDALIAKTMENLNGLNNNRTRVLQDEIELLKQLLENRRVDLETQRETLVVQRDSYRLQISDLEKQNETLRRRIQEITRDNLSSLESIKVKMGFLHQADVTGLAKIHQARINALTEELVERGKQQEEMSKRLHLELQAKLHIRKEYELETSKLKSKVMDLRIQLNAVQIEMKDNITSMKSQLDVTSQGLIKDRETKARTLKSYEDEMRKLRQTIDAKDEQLKLVEENSNQKEQYYKNLSQGEGEKVRGLKLEMEEREKRKAKELFSKDEDINRLKKTIQQLKQQLLQQQALRKKKIRELEKSKQDSDQKLKQALKEIQLLKDRIAALEHDLNLTRGDIQTVRFQQQAAANQERGKTQQFIGKTHSGFKDYYEKRIKELENDKLELQAINTTQSQHINELVAKYKQLEDALKILLESQKKLSDLENRIIHLGMDNNLVKNLAQLIKRPFH